jgi:hypothetical protein
VATVTTTHSAVKVVLVCSMTEHWYCSTPNTCGKNFRISAFVERIIEVG